MPDATPARSGATSASAIRTTDGGTSPCPMPIAAMAGGQQRAAVTQAREVLARQLLV